MATGWAREGAVQEQIDSTVADAVALARSRIAAAGPGLTHCEECGDEIPLRRRQAVAGARLCVRCQSEADGNAVKSGINRRGSKDSQLR